MAGTVSLTYPGLGQWLSFEFTDYAGIEPARIILERLVEPPRIGQRSRDIAVEGDFVLGYADPDFNIRQQITVKNCRYVEAFTVQESGGKIQQVTFFDERWSWPFYTISGRYNFSLVKAYDSAFIDNAVRQFVDPAHEKTPRELVQLCFKAMGYTDDQWDLTDLPNLARPEVDWNRAVASVELDKIVNDLGCEIVPVRSKKKWKVVVTGDGRSLPNDWPYESPAYNNNPAERPDWLAIETAPILYEGKFLLEAIGKDIDEKWYKLDDLTYAPAARGQGDAFRDSDPQFYDVSPTRVLMADRVSLVSPRELAQQTVYRVFRINRFSSDMRIAGFDARTELTDISQLVFQETLVESFIEPGATAAAQLPAYVEGTFWTDKSPSMNNYPAGTRIYKPSPVYQNEQFDDVTTMSIQNSDNARFLQVIFSRMMRSVGDPVDTGDFIEQSIMMPPQIYLHTSVKIRDWKTWAFNRWQFRKWIGDGPPNDRSKRIKTYIKDDIQPWYRENPGTTQTDNNYAMCRDRAIYYLDRLAKLFEHVTGSTRSYIGWMVFDLDGKRKQVTYSHNESGTTTIASTDTEHHWDIPPYEARRARDARGNAKELGRVQQEVLDELRRLGINL